MNIKKSLKALVALAIAGTFSANAVAAPSNAEIFDMMQEMKKELKNLKAENNALKVPLKKSQYRLMKPLKLKLN